MLNFYHPAKDAGRPVPHILGLTASPSIQANTNSVMKLEIVLDAICRSPTIHREELLAHVKKPEIQYKTYRDEDPQGSASISRLSSAYHNLNIREDPKVLRLTADPTSENQKLLEKICLNNDTYVQREMKALCGRAVAIRRTLGAWPAEWYIWKAIAGHLPSISVPARKSSMKAGPDEETIFLGNTLRKVEVKEPQAVLLGLDMLSNKVNMLIDALVECAGDDVRGIVFTKERAHAATLAHVLAIHPRLQGKYTVNSIVGSSKYHSRKREVWDISKLDSRDVMQQFRTGHTNLLVATSVVEEGIDVPACNLVICFDPVETLKSFIQRRGRARSRESKLIIFHEKSDRPTQQNWEKWEEDLRRIYESEDRQRQNIAAWESLPQDPIEPFIIESIGARLDMDNARQHLDHFCKQVSSGEYVDARPDYRTTEVARGPPPLLQVEVFLPIFLPEDVRYAKSEKYWKSEKSAIKEAAFHAYVALYKKGLVTDNLLPFKSEDFTPPDEPREGEVDINALFDPWIKVAQAWEESADCQEWLATLKNERGSVKTQCLMHIPCQLTYIRPMTAYINHRKTWTVEFEHVSDNISARDSTGTRDDTAILLALPFKHRWPTDESRQHVVRFVAQDTNLVMKHIAAEKFAPRHAESHPLPYLIRDSLGCPHTYEELLHSKPAAEAIRKASPKFDEAPDDGRYLSLRRLSKRSDFLHPLNLPPARDNRAAEATQIKRYSCVMPVSEATVDTIPLEYAEFGMLIPAILHHLEIHLIADELNSECLQSIGISDSSLVLTAISSRSAREQTDYERIEFLGDSILKVLTTVNVFAERMLFITCIFFMLGIYV
jgi:hypothetical protein